MINISSESKLDKGYDKVSADEQSIMSKGKKRIYILKEEENKGDSASFSSDFDVRTKDSF